MPRSLSDYLDLTQAQAVEQWRRVLSRPPTAGRQETYLPIEVLLAYSLFYVVSPNRYGGANIHKAPKVVHQLAALTKRSPGSFTSKMLNLDGSRSNAGQFEWRVFMALSGAADLHAHLYNTVLGAARECGIGEELLPDFLGRLGSARIELVGQDELEPDDLHEATRDEAKALATQLGASLAQTTRIAEYRARVGQHRFARAVLHNCGDQCVFCGLSGLALPSSRLLIASHIKPWAKSTATERLDVRNGVAACPTHDAAFDSGLLTINGGLSIHRATALDGAVSRDPAVRQFFDRPFLRDRAELPQGATPPAKRYLAYHKQHIFRAST